MSEKFTGKGLGVAMITPFDKNNQVDYNAIKKIVENFLKNNVDYIVLLGTTSEYPCLSQEEQKKVVDFVKAIVNKRIPLVIGIGGNNTQEVLKKIETTDLQDIMAILTVAPYYNKPNQDGLYAHFAEISKKSPLDLIVYNVPSRTGVNILPTTLLRLANDFKNIIAVKEASGSVDQIMKIVKDKPKNFTVISGDDALTLPLMSVGVAGVISVAGNAFPKEISEIVHLAAKNEFCKASEIHYKYLESIDLMFAEGNPVGVKYFMNKLSMCEYFVRLPLVPASENLKEKINLFLNKL